MSEPVKPALFGIPTIGEVTLGGERVPNNQPIFDFGLTEERCASRHEAWKAWLAKEQKAEPQSPVTP